MQGRVSDEEGLEGIGMIDLVRMGEEAGRNCWIPVTEVVF